MQSYLDNLITGLVSEEDIQTIQENNIVKLIQILQTTSDILLNEQAELENEKLKLESDNLRIMKDFQEKDRLNIKITPEMLPVGAIQPDTEDLDLSLAVIKLPRKIREAIILYYYQDMSTEEIAETLGIAQSSVSNRLRRGREKLRKMLEGRDQDA